MSDAKGPVEVGGRVFAPVDVEFIPEEATGARLSRRLDPKGVSAWSVVWGSGGRLE